MERSRPVFLIAAAVMLLAAALAATQTVNAAQSGWSAIKQLTNCSGGCGNYPPYIAVDSQKRAHIGYVNYTGGRFPYYMKLTSQGDVDYTIKLTDQPTLAFTTRIAVDSGNNIHFVWKGINGTYFTVYKKLDSSGNVLVNDTRVSSDKGDMPDVAVDSNGNPGIVTSVYNSSLPSPNNWFVMYTKLDGLGNVIVPEKKITDTHNENWGPAIAIDSLGNSHIAWADRRYYGAVLKHEVYYIQLDSNGSVVINETMVSGGGDTSYNPLDIAVDSQRNVYITWTDTRDGFGQVYYSKLAANGSVLKDDTRLTFSNTSDFDKHSIAIGPDDDLHLVWAVGWNYGIYYKRLNPDGTIVVNDTLVTDGAAGGIRPDIAVSSNDVAHIVWAEGFNQLYYRTYK